MTDDAKRKAEELLERRRDSCGYYDADSIEPLVKALIYLANTSLCINAGHCKELAKKHWCGACKGFANLASVVEKLEKEKE